MTQRRRQSGSWDSKAVERIRAAHLIDRLQANALGELDETTKAFPALVERILDVLGCECSPEQRKALLADIDATYERLKMDMPAVKSAEIVLRKILPDLAQVEQKNTTQNLHVVMMPQHAETTKDWNRMVHEQRAMAAPSGAAELASVVSDS